MGKNEAVHGHGRVIATLRPDHLRNPVVDMELLDGRRGVRSRRLAVVRQV